MATDNFKISSNNVSLWNKNVKSVKNKDKKSTSSENKFNVAKMDTFEITNKSTQSTSNFKVTPEINKEKADIVKELSQTHSDVNRFLEIKSQVRAGKYEIDSQGIADSLIPHLGYDLKA